MQITLEWDSEGSPPRRNGCSIFIGTKIIHTCYSVFLIEYTDTTAIPTFSAKFIVGNAISFVQKQCPLLFPFLTHSRHNSQSSFPAEYRKLQVKYIKPCLYHFSGRKQDKNPFLNEIFRWRALQ